MKLYDLPWKRSADTGKARWEKGGVLIDKGHKKSIKLDMISVSKDWDGWLVVSERRAREDSGREPSLSSEPEPF